MPAGLSPAQQRAWLAVDDLFAAMKEIDRRDPRFMAAMRKYGLIERIQELLSASAAASDEVAALLQEKGL